MRKIVSILLIAVMLTALMPAGVFASDSITVILNGEAIQFDVPPKRSKTRFPGTSN